jgi:hypothetical protein
MNYYDADEYWHCEHGFGPLRFDSQGRFFRCIRDIAHVRVLVSGMAGDCLKLFFLQGEEEGLALHCELLVDGMALAASCFETDGVFELVVDVRGIRTDASGGFVLEIKNNTPSSEEAIFDGESRSSLRLHRVGY